MAAEIRKPPMILVAVVVGGALLLVALAVVALVQYVGFAMQSELDKKVLTRPSPQLAALRVREKARLTTYRWVDKKAGIVRIPVDRALELTLRDWRRP